MPEDELPPQLFQCKGVWEEKCGVTLRGLKSNLSLNSFANVLSPSPSMSSKSTDLLRMWEGIEGGGMFVRLSLPPCLPAPPPPVPAQQWHHWS